MSRAERRAEKVEQTSASDKLNVEIHARNIYTPSHMEWTLDGRLLAVERSAGRIKDITEGGDMRDEESVAHGLSGPASIAPLADGRVLVNESYKDQVTDITDGGDCSDAEAFATDVEHAYSIVPVDMGGDQERLFVMHNNDAGDRSWVTEITAGGEITEDDRVVTDVPATEVVGAVPRAGVQPHDEEWTSDNLGCGEWCLSYEGNLCYATGSMGQLVEVPDEALEADETPTHMDLLDQGSLLARGLNYTGGGRYNPNDGLIYMTEPQNGAVVAIDPDDPGNYRFEPRVVEGLGYPSCIRFGPDNEAYICDRTADVVWKITDF